MEATRSPYLPANFVAWDRLGIEWAKRFRSWYIPAPFHICFKPEVVARPPLLGGFNLYKPKNPLIVGGVGAILKKSFHLFRSLLLGYEGKNFKILRPNSKTNSARLRTPLLDLYTWMERASKDRTAHTENSSGARIIRFWATRSRSKRNSPPLIGQNPLIGKRRIAAVNTAGDVGTIAHPLPLPAHRNFLSLTFLG